MREDICLILNEREPLKHQLAKELEAQLHLRKLSCARIEPSEHIVDIIRERNPRILVADYILGDVATGLDILIEIQNEPIGVIIWTDELSINVAVSAMKYGARDFIEMNSLRSLEKVLQAIEAELETQLKDSEPISFHQAAITVDPPICYSNIFHTCLETTESLALRKPNVFVIQGESGSGRNTVARYFYSKRTNNGHLTEIDLDTWPNNSHTLYGSDYDPRIVPLLSYNSTIFIDHAEFDTAGELTEGVCKRLQKLWPSSASTIEKPTLIIGTKCPDTARSWRLLLGCEIIDLPPLRKRQEDFLPLMQLFSQEAKELTNLAKLQISVPLIEELVALDWPGNIKELRAVTIEASTSLASLSSKDSGSSDKHDSISSKKMKNTLEAILRAKARWESYDSLRPVTPTPLVARRAVDNALGNLRIAAAKLGTGVSQLRHVLQANNNNSPEIELLESH